MILLHFFLYFYFYRRRPNVASTSTLLSVSQKIHTPRVLPPSQCLPTPPLIVVPDAQNGEKNYFLWWLLIKKFFCHDITNWNYFFFIFFYVICLKNLSHSILFFYFSYWHWWILFFIFPFHFSELDDDENQKDTVRNRSMGSIETDFTSVTQLK